MKEIKFRGKRKDNGEWVYGSLTVCNAFDLKDGIHDPQPFRTIIYKQDIEWISDPDNKRWTFPSYEVIPETVGQLINLLDNSDKEIYGSIPIDGKMSKGGDIVKSPGAKQAMAVQYQPPSFIMRAKTKSGGWSKSWSEFILHHKDRQFQKIIGTVAENPELLEAKE